MTVRVRNENTANGLYQAGFSVVFAIDPSSTGTAVLLGGEGQNGAGTRFDVSGVNGASDGGHATIALSITRPGTIIVNATIPACGTSGYGKWMNQVTLDPPITIIGAAP